MAKKFQTLVNKMSSESQARVKAKIQKLIADIALDELCEARKLTHEQLAQQLNVKQPSIPRMEKCADMYVSTLRGVISVIRTL